MELFMAWYSGDFFERFMMKNRVLGPYGWSYAALIVCNVIMPNTLWWKKARTNTIWLFIVSLFVGVGMWLERFVIIVTSLYRDYMPSSWGYYKATVFDWMFFVGTGGLFLTLMLLFVRFLPAIPMSEIKMILPGAEGRVKR
jgi:molybdopterin-containing oxidoreductase family membrane subunit